MRLANGGAGFDDGSALVVGSDLVNAVAISVFPVLEFSDYVEL